MLTTTIVDTDALLALINPTDELHERAVQMAEAVYTNNCTVLLLPTTLSEFAAVSAYQVGVQQTQVVLESLMKNAQHILLEIDTSLSRIAMSIFLAQKSKKESLFDCFVMAAATRYHVDAIFSFDEGYKKQRNSFVLIEDIEKNDSARKSE